MCEQSCLQRDWQVDPGMTTFWGSRNEFNVIKKNNNEIKNSMWQLNKYHM